MARFRWRGPAGCLVVAALALAGCAAPHDTHTSAPPPVRAVYGSTLRDSSGAIDIQGTVAALKQVGANQYFYLLRSEVDRALVTPQTRATNQDWVQLTAFADAAAEAGITVVVYLLPPAETTAGAYPPYGWDYAGWARAIAAIATHHHAIIGVAIDDFAGATVAYPGRVTITAELVGTMHASLASAGVKFWAVLYSHDILADDRLVKKYRGTVDGLVHVFGGEDEPRSHHPSTRDAAGLLALGPRIRARANAWATGSPPVPVITMVYAAPLGYETGRTVTPAYLRSAMQQAGLLVTAGASNGTVVYLAPLPRKPPAATNPLTTVVRDSYR